MHVAPANSVEVANLAIAYVRRRTRSMQTSAIFVAATMVVGTVVCALFFRPPLQLVLFPFAEIALLILIGLPLVCWRMSRHMCSILERLGEIESEPSLAERFAMLRQFKREFPGDGLRPLWHVFERKVTILEADIE